MNQPGEDLVIGGVPGVGELVVPAGELVERFSRSPGSGGQSVNTADSRVELVFDVARSTALSTAQRERVLSRLDSDTVVITASEHRSQFRNRAAARERLGKRLLELLAPPAPPRRPTKPTRGSQRRRLEAKKQRSITKSLRGRVTE
ncbi:peptide chain release factor 1 [Nocardioides sp. Soil797]|nr:peptide chain release factor 1 [Nocardioides sp. Soil797]